MCSNDSQFIEVVEISTISLLKQTKESLPSAKRILNNDTRTVECEIIKNLVESQVHDAPFEG
jgi:hypothetical protein